MANKIRWSRSDSITLGKAVSNFNKTVQKLEQEESNLLLPDVISFKDLKSDITTRRELNRIIKSLKRLLIFFSSSTCIPLKAFSKVPARLIN